MSANLYKAPTTNFWSSSLNGAINDTVDTITLNSTSGLQSPGFLIIDRENGTGTVTANAREVIKYTGISGSDLTGVTRGADGSTARSHSDGALVEATLTVGMHNDQRDAINTEHFTNGLHAPIASATITTLNVTTLNPSFLPTKGHFYWSRSGALATVLEATAGDTHFPMQRATKNLTLTNFFGALHSAPSLAPAEFDITYSSAPTLAFATIFTTRPFIDIGEYTTTSGATPAVLALTSLASGTLLKFEIKQHGNAGELMAQLTATERA